MGPSQVEYLFENKIEGLLTSITWVGNETEGDCNATAKGEGCATCTLCSDGTVTADCTNLDQGRMVKCGETQVNGESYPFFPFLSGKMAVEPTPSGAVASSTLSQVAFVAVAVSMVVLGGW